MQVEQVAYAAFAPDLIISDESQCILADVYINKGGGTDVDQDQLTAVLMSMFNAIQTVVTAWK